MDILVSRCATDYAFLCKRMIESLKCRAGVLHSPSTLNVGFTIPGTPDYGIIIGRDNFPGKNRFRR